MRNRSGHATKSSQALDPAKLKLQTPQFCFGLLPLGNLASQVVVGLRQLRGPFLDSMIELIVSLPQRLFGSFTGVCEVTRQGGDRCENGQAQQGMPIQGDVVLGYEKIFER